MSDVEIDPDQPQVTFKMLAAQLDTALLFQFFRLLVAIFAVAALAVGALALRDMAEEAQAQTVEAQAQTCFVEAQVIIQFFGLVGVLGDRSGESDELQQGLLDEFQECKNLPGDQYRNPGSDD